MQLSLDKRERNTKAVSKMAAAEEKSVEIKPERQDSRYVFIFALTYIFNQFCLILISE